jgi:transcriptional regulator with XRE-family HTH domain
MIRPLSNPVCHPDLGDTLNVGSGDCVGQAVLGYHPNMGLNQRAESYFSKRLRSERDRRGWSQDELAKRLSDKGVHVYASTIAKIESGSRAARLNEVAAVADLLEVSIDTLLGRSVSAKNDEMYAFKALLDTAQQASWQVSSVETTLRERVAELAAFDLPRMMKDFQSDCERACDALAAANDALSTPMKPGGGNLQRLTRKLLLQELQKEVRADEAQS